MKQFEYTIKDPIGLHARPAGMLAKQCKNYAPSVVSVCKGEKSADCTRLMAVMALGIKCGDTVVFRVENGDEEDTAASLKEYCENNL